MKIRVLSVAVLVIAAISFASCKKSSSNSIALGTLTATIDGANYNFDSVYSGEFFKLNPEFAFETEFIDDSANLAEIYIESEDSTASLKTKSYYDTDTTIDLEVAFKLDGAQYESAGVSTNPFKITLISGMQGTFSGTVYLNGDSTAASKTITNGKFNYSLY